MKTRLYLILFAVTLIAAGVFVFLAVQKNGLIVHWIAAGFLGLTSILLLAQFAYWRRQKPLTSSSLKYKENVSEKR